MGSGASQSSSSSMFPSLVNQLMFPGPPEQCKRNRDFASLRLNGSSFLQNVYFVPSSTVVAQTGPNKGKCISCPVIVRNALKDHPTVAPRPFVLVYFHGNAEALEDSINLVEAIGLYLNCTVVAIEFPGYGVTEEDFASTRPADIDAWAEDLLLWLTKTIEIPASQIIPFGRSIGTGPAARMASVMFEKYGLAAPGLVLNAPFISIHQMGKLIAGPLGGLIAGNPWNTEEAVRMLDYTRTKLLILHGQDDEIIPYEHGRKLFDIYRGQVSAHFPDSRGHNDFQLEDYLLPLQEFFRKYYDDHPNYADIDVNAFVETIDSNLRKWRTVPPEYIREILPPAAGSSSQKKSRRGVCNNPE